MEVGKFSRVNGAWLKENVGNQVALVGKVVESAADTVKITASVRSFLFVFETLTCFNQHEDLICLSWARKRIWLLRWVRVLILT